ncbi:hypothetical protein GCM10023321_33770 [Pseudonocardia eucalypti]|uniref:DUF4345 domain-containing protein n=1 Tax=Pseudonocardia eucalypti TaxID=648755 RepID=A0ABP9Q973_9PSEU|nr:hypothetical protein [Pseudonocardia eucalypti]
MSVRVGLVFVGAVQGVIGVWQLLAPRSFFEDFPLSEHPWVALLGPYNQHLVVDVGAFNLAMALLLGWAAVVLQRQLTLAALASGLVFGALHLGFHATHLEHFPTADAVSQTVGLVAWLLLLAGLFRLACVRLSGH